MVAIDTLRKEMIYPAQDPAQVAQPETQRRQKARAQTRSTTKDRLSLIAGLFLLAGFAIFIVGRFATIMVNNYDIQGMQAELQAQLAKNAAIEANVAELSAPTRILSIAQNTLKMKPATPVPVGANNH